MKSIKLFSITIALFLAASLAQAASVSGTVTDKTTGKPAVGDTVVLVSPMTGMSEVARTTTDARGHYSLDKPGNAPYLIRATHQGAEFFIDAGAASGDISVSDVAAKVQGVYIEADVIEVEADNGQLKVNERYFVHNTSNPPTTQWSKKSFEVVLPADAVVNDVGGQRPGGLPTSIKLEPEGPKGHYSFNFPIQPDDGDKDTLFLLSYTLPYKDGKYSFKAEVTLPADNVAVLLPKSMTFTGSSFKSVPQDPGIQTLLAKNAKPGTPLEFTISGTGSIPREDQAAPSGQQPAAMGQGSDASAPAAGGQPGGGIGNPINTPDPLSKYKWWILGGLALLLAAAAAFLLRKPAVAAGVPTDGAIYPTSTAQAVASSYNTPASKNAALLNALKEELFAIESEKISGTITPEEYASVKAALETVLKLALNRK
jgi:Carboxypeptidase regulatory-like domain